MRGRPGARLLVSALGVVGASLLALVLVEGWLRLSGAEQRRVAMSLYYQGAYPEVHQVSQDPILRYELRPGARLESEGPYGRFSIQINSLGARGPERARERPPGTYRIVCLGPSTTFGADVSDGQAMPAVLEEALRGRGGGPPVEVWNYGTSAYVPSQMSRLALRLLPELEPDLVVMWLHNQGRRAYLPPAEGQVLDWRPLFEADPDAWEESFPPPAGGLATLHGGLVRRVALYRYVMAQRLLVGQAGAPLGPPVGDALHVRLGAQLVARARERGVGLVVVGYFGTNDLYWPGVPRDHLIDQIPDLAAGATVNIHPPSEVLAGWAEHVAGELLARGLVPRGEGVGEVGPP